MSQVSDILAVLRQRLPRDQVLRVGWMCCSWVLARRGVGRIGKQQPLRALSARSRRHDPWTGARPLPAQDFV